MTLRKLAGDTLIYGSGFILGKVLNFVLIAVYLTWKFDGEQEQYGLYTEFYFYVALLLVILTLRMETTFFRFGSEEGQKSKAFDQAAMLLVLTSGIWITCLFLWTTEIAAALQYPGFEIHIIVLGLVLALDILVAIPFAALRLEQRPLRFAALKISGIAINIIAVLVFLELLPNLAERGHSLVQSWYHPDHRLLYVFIANLLGSLFVFVAFFRRYFKMKWKFDKELTRKMLRYTFPLIVVGIAGVINQSGYIVLLKTILPGDLMENLSVGGVYAAATRIAILMSLFITAFNYAAEPFFFSQSRNRDAKQTYADVAKAFTIVGTIIFVGILMYIDLIQLLLGTSFRTGMYVVPILLMAFFLLGLYYNFSIWYKLTDRTRYGAIISSIGAIITVSLSFVLIPLIDMEGSAWATLACYAFMAGACYFIGKKFYPVPYDMRRIGTMVLLALATYGVSVFVNTLVAGPLGITLTINTLLMLGFVWVIYSLEKDLIWSVLWRKNGF
jgi:O-antigen/teichoic acid export membrane protein